MARKALWIALGVFVCTLLLTSLGRGRAPSATLLVGLVVTLILVSSLIGISTLLAIFVHELGHLVAGQIAGFRFLSLAMGPLEIRRDAGKLRFARAPLLGGVAGYVRMVPGPTDRLDRRLRLYILGGPIASLLYAFLAYGLFLAARPWSARGAPIGAYFGYLAALCLLVMALAIVPGALLPFTTRSGTPTDMKMLFQLSSSTPEQARMVAYFQHMKEVHGNVRPREWTRSFLDGSRFPEDGSDAHVRALLMLYYHSLDQGDLGAARSFVDLALPHAEKLRKGSLVRESVLLESAFLAAWYDRDLETAQLRWEAAGPPSDFTEGIRSRADAAIAMRRGETDRALEVVAKAEATLRTSGPRYGESPALHLDLFEAIRQEVAAERGVAIS